MNGNSIMSTNYLLLYRVILTIRESQNRTGKQNLPDKIVRNSESPLKKRHGYEIKTGALRDV